MGRTRREAREAKYSPVIQPKPQIGLHGKHYSIPPEPKPPRHGREPAGKYEREDRWQ
jgi:hypothetical protein